MSESLEIQCQRCIDSIRDEMGPLLTEAREREFRSICALEYAFTVLPSYEKAPTGEGQGRA